MLTNEHVGKHFKEVGQQREYEYVGQLETGEHVLIDVCGAPLQVPDYNFKMGWVPFE